MRHNTLAGVLSDLGEWEAARRHYEESLRLEGGIDAAEGSTADIRRQNLAVVYRHLGDLVGARRLFERALADTVARHGERHPDVGIRKANLGTLLAEMGHLDDAGVLLRDALDSAAARDPHSPEVATRMANLAEVRMRMGDLDGARDLIVRSIEIDAKNYGPDHHHLSNGYQSLGVLALYASDALAAEAHLRKALDYIVLSGEKGSGHPDTLIIRSNLAAALGKQGRRDDARAELRAVEGAVSRLPVNSPIRVGVESVCRAVRKMLGPT